MVDHISGHLGIERVETIAICQSAHALPKTDMSDGDRFTATRTLTRFLAMPASARRLISNMIDDLKEERDELALQLLGDEIKEGYRRIRRSMS